MKRVGWIAALVMMASGMALCYADQAGGTGNVRPDPATEAGQRRAAAYIKEIDPIVTLSEEQKQKITELMVALAKAAGEFETKNGEKLKAADDAMREAAASGDTAAMARANEDVEDAHAGMKEPLRKYNEQMERVLTAGQKAKLADSRMRAWIKQMTAPVQLTEQQIQAVKAAVGEGDTLMQYFAIRQAVDEVMTPEQKAVFRKAQGMMMVKFWTTSLGLTEEQAKQMEGACEKLARDADLTAAEINEQLMKKVEGLLTPEQKAARKKAQEEQAAEAKRELDQLRGK